MIYVMTKYASYTVDRKNHRWMRTSDTVPKHNDGIWVAGEFTLGEVGQTCFAHYADDPRGALGRWTSPVLAVSEVDS